MCELLCCLARFSLLFNLTIMSFFLSFFFFFTNFQQVGISVISKFFFHNCNFLFYSYLLLCHECIFIYFFMNRNYMYSNSFWYFYIISMLLDINPLIYEFVASEFVAFLRCLMILGGSWFYVLSYDHQLTPWLFLAVTFLVMSLVYV